MSLRCKWYKCKEHYDYQRQMCAHIVVDHMLADTDPVRMLTNTEVPFLVDKKPNPATINIDSRKRSDTRIVLNDEEDVTFFEENVEISCDLGRETEFTPIVPKAFNFIHSPEPVAPAAEFRNFKPLIKREPTPKRSKMNRYNQIQRTQTLCGSCTKSFTSMRQLKMHLKDHELKEQTHSSKNIKSTPSTKKVKLTHSSKNAM